MKRLGTIVKYTLVVIALVYVGAVAYDVTKTPEKAPEQPSVAVAEPEVEQPPTVDELLKLVNEERAKVGVKPLKLYDGLMDTAQERADDMVERDYFSHFDPIDGKKLINEQDPNCMGMSENIYWGRATNTSKGAMTWWMNSKPHREAIQNPKYTLTGIGIAENKVVQHFCIAK